MFGSKPNFELVQSTWCAASSCGAMIVADKKVLTLAGLGKEERRIGGVMWGMVYFGRGRQGPVVGKPPIPPLLPLCSVMYAAVTSLPT
jgi:hypothetical protein